MAYLRHTGGRKFPADTNAEPSMSELLETCELAARAGASELLSWRGRFADPRKGAGRHGNRRRSRLAGGDPCRNRRTFSPSFIRRRRKNFPGRGGRRRSGVASRPARRHDELHPRLSLLCRLRGGGSRWRAARRGDSRSASGGNVPGGAGAGRFLQRDAVSNQQRENRRRVPGRGQPAAARCRRIQPIWRILCGWFRRARLCVAAALRP